MDIYALRSLAEIGGNAGFIAIMGMLDEEVQIIQQEIMGMKGLENSSLYMMKLQNVLNIKNKILSFVDQAKQTLEDTNG